MRVIDRYIASHCALAFALVLIVLLILFSFLTLIDVLEDVGKGSFTATDAIAIVVLTTPSLILDLLPVVSLLGAVFGLGVLTNHSELTAMRASGRSVKEIASVLLVLAFLLSLAALAMQTYIVPNAERKAQTFRSRALDQTELNVEQFWSRAGLQIIHVGLVEYGRFPKNIEIFTLNRNRNLRQIITAERAEILGPKLWRLSDVEITQFRDSEVTVHHFARYEWDSFLSRKQMETLVTPTHAVSVFDLHQYLKASKNNGLDNHQIESRFWHLINQPLSIIAMFLLSVPLVIGSNRRQSMGFRLIIGGLIGIGFYLLQQASGQLSEIYYLPPAYSALLPSVIVVLATGFLLNRRAA